MKWKICGVSELPELLGWATHVVSISSPGYRHEVPPLPDHPVKVLRIDMDDVEQASRPTTRASENSSCPPQIKDVQKIIDFGRRIPADAHLIVHCQMGISRSTAAMLSILAAREPDQLCSKFMTEVAQARSIAMPNRLIIRLADQLLHRKGELTGAVDTHWAKVTGPWLDSLSNPLL